MSYLRLAAHALDALTHIAEHAQSAPAGMAAIRGITRALGQAEHGTITREAAAAEIDYLRERLAQGDADADAALLARYPHQ